MKKLIIQLTGVLFMIAISSNNILAQMKRLPFKLSVIIDENTVYSSPQDVYINPPLQDCNVCIQAFDQIP